MAGRRRGMGRVFQRGERWWIAYYSGGVEQRESAGDTEKEATAVLSTRLLAIGRGEPVTADAGRVTVNELLDAWLAYLVERRAKRIAGARSKVKPLRRLLGHVRVPQLAPEVIRTRYIAERRAEGMKDGTIHVELLVLTAALNRARKEGRLAVVPYVPKPSASPHRREYPEPETLAKILGSMKSEPHRDAIDFADTTAWRKEEVCALEWSAVFRRDGEIRLPDTKNGDPRVIPLVYVDERGQRHLNRAGAIIERRWKARLLTSPLVFHHRGGRSLYHSLLDHLKKACRAAGVDRQLVHNLRRSGVRNLVRGGASQSVAMSISGHRDPAVFQRYNITSTEDQQRALAGTDRYVAARVANADSSRTMRPGEAR